MCFMSDASEFPFRDDTVILYRVVLHWVVYKLTLKTERRKKTMHVDMWMFIHFVVACMWDIYFLLHLLRQLICQDGGCFVQQWRRAVLRQETVRNNGSDVTVV